MHTLISLCAGIGGLDLAAQWAGFQTIRFVEKDSYCQKVLSARWPDVPIDDDVYTAAPHKADVYCAGFPCQPFSEAGKRLGDKDERHILPRILEMINDAKPYVFLLENVPGFSELNHGSEFRKLLGKITSMGFNAQWGHIRASDFGAPHKRERFFIVAYSSSPRLERQNWQKLGSGKFTGCSVNRPGPEIRQSRVVRAADGIPRGMDFYRWPSRRNSPQFDHEPPRRIETVSNRKSRQIALGNAVVPQVAYPIFLSIAEYLNHIKDE